MLRIYDESCALVNKQGVCDQCSQLNGWFNPAQEQQAALMQIQRVKERDQHNRQALLRLRTLLIREIDPLLTHGADLHELFLRLNQQANEVDV